MASIASVEVKQQPELDKTTGEKVTDHVKIERVVRTTPRDKAQELLNTSQNENNTAVESQRGLALDEPDTPLDELRFRPFVLKPWFLFLVITFNIIIISLLILLCIKPKFELLNEWAYFVLQIFPTVIGTITTATLEAVITALSRITPFMRCARPDGDAAATSILLPYVPLLGPINSIRSGNWILFWANFILWLGYPVLGLKAALLSASIDDGVAEVTNWTLYALLTAYVIITVFIACVVIFLERHPTGLREGWDTVDIADHLVLFRKSDFLDKFEGSCVATKESMGEVFAGMKVKLGFWPQEGDGGRWFGFREVEPGPAVKPPEGKNDRTFSLKQLSRLRFNSVFSAMKRLPLILSTTLATLILVGYIIALAFGSRQPTRNTFDLPVSTGVSAFLFNFFLTSVLSLYSLFWEDIYLFSAITEPFVQMGNNPRGATADEALLLNYTSSPRPIAIYDAASRRHWKIVRTAGIALLQRLLPIIAGASISVSNHSASPPGSSTIQLSTPLSIFTIGYLASYILLIPYEVYSPGYTRHLPRDSLTIADLISWSCSSSILRGDNNLPSDTENDSPETGLLAGNPLDTSAEEPWNRKWCMEARLRLARKRYGFRLEGVKGTEGGYTMGITTVGGGEREAPELWRNARGLLKRVHDGRGKGGGDVEGGTEQERGGGYRILGAGRFEVIGGGEGDVLERPAEGEARERQGE